MNGAKLGGGKIFCSQSLFAFSLPVLKVQVWELAGVQLSQSGKTLSSYVGLRSFVSAKAVSLFDPAGTESHCDAT